MPQLLQLPFSLSSSISPHRLQVLELSSARKALSVLLEEDGDGYAITAAIEHARRVGVDSEVSAW